MIAANNYLICCPDIQATSIIASLEQINLGGIYLPLMELVFDEQKLRDLENNINQFDYVILSSPAVIDYVKSALPRATYPTFLTVGRSSSILLSQYTKQPVIYPEHGSGRSALLKEQLTKLNWDNKKVLEISGTTISSTSDINISQQPIITSWYKENLAINCNNSEWQILTIYKRVLCVPDAEYVQKILLTTRLSGIIATSTTLVNCLFQQAKIAGYDSLLKECVFFTLHEHIKEVLLKFGVSKIIVSPIASKESLIASLGER